MYLVLVLIHPDLLITQTPYTSTVSMCMTAPPANKHSQIHPSSYPKPTN
jgi:hypothetical protein